jgi:hypothetical protein
MEITRSPFAVFSSIRNIWWWPQPARTWRFGCPASTTTRKRRPDVKKVKLWMLFAKHFGEIRKSDRFIYYFVAVAKKQLLCFGGKFKSWSQSFWGWFFFKSHSLYFSDFIWTFFRIFVKVQFWKKTGSFMKSVLSFTFLCELFGLLSKVRWTRWLL